MIEAKLAKVLTPYTAAITAGTEQGVQVGDIALIADLVTIYDPATREQLGEVSVEKVAGKVESVKERVAVVRVTTTYRQASERYLKRLTDDPDLADFTNVLVAPGDHVEISSPIEAPF